MYIVERSVKNGERRVDLCMHRPDILPDCGYTCDVRLVAALDESLSAGPQYLLYRPIP